MRGRVFATLFMLNALVGIPPMLLFGEAADRIGIPRVLVVAGMLTIVIGVVIRADVWRPWLSGRGRGPFGGGIDEDRRQAASEEASQ